LRSAAAHPETSTNWEALFNWGSAILRPPKRGGKKHNLTTCIKKRISDYSPAACYQPPDPAKPAQRKSSSTATMLAQAVAAKLEDGNLKAAIRLLVSDEEPAAPSADGLAKLKQKHPPASLSANSLPPPEPSCQLVVTESDVRKAKGLCSTFLPLWTGRRCMGSTCFCVQARAGSHSVTPCTQRHHRPRLCFCRGSCFQGTVRSLSRRHPKA